MQFVTCKPTVARMAKRGKNDAVMNKHLEARQTDGESRIYF